MVFPLPNGRTSWRILFLGEKAELAVTGARSAFFMTVPQAAHFGPKHPTLPVCKTSASWGPQQWCCPGFNFLPKIRALQQRFRGFFLPSRSFTNVFFSCTLGRYLPWQGWGHEPWPQNGIPGCHIQRILDSASGSCRGIVFHALAFVYVCLLDDVEQSSPRAGLCAAPAGGGGGGLARNPWNYLPLASLSHAYRPMQVEEPFGLTTSFSNWLQSGVRHQRSRGRQFSQSTFLSCLYIMSMPGAPKGFPILPARRRRRSCSFLSWAHCRALFYGVLAITREAPTPILTIMHTLHVHAPASSGWKQMAQLSMCVLGKGSDTVSTCGWMYGYKSMWDYMNARVHGRGRGSTCIRIRKAERIGICF